jgi:transcription antitermination factor NusG
MTYEQSERWYALHVSPNCENVVSIRLRETGITEYLPLVPQPECPSRSPSARRPLFPGYVFCCHDLTCGRKLYTIPGIIRIVGYGKRPVAIEDDEIEAIRRIVDSRLPIQSWPYLQPGDNVRVTDGPFAGISGVVLRSQGKKKLVVALPLLQRSLAVTVCTEWTSLGAAA